MKVKEDIIKKILNKLYLDHFPDACPIGKLCGKLDMNEDEEVKSILAAGCYSKEKGWIDEIVRPKDDEREWRINASGIDFLEGDFLKPEPVKPGFWQGK